jgi:cysteine-rich repeat protein
MAQSHSAPRVDSQLRGVEEDNALLTSSCIIALHTAFTSEAPTEDNAILTLSLLAQLLGGGTDLSYQAIVSSRMLLGATSGTIDTEAQDRLASDVAQKLLKDVLTCSERLWVLSREYQSEMEMLVASHILGALEVAVLHLMSSELVGDVIELHSCPLEDDTCKLSSVSETIQVNLMADVTVPSSAGKDDLRVILSKQTIKQVETLQALSDAAGLVDVHVQRLNTFWALAAGEILLSQLYIFSVTSGGVLVMDSVDLVKDGQILVQVPIYVKHLLASKVKVNLLEPALIENEQIYPALKELDKDRNNRLSPDEMVLDLPLLMKRYLFWECLEWASGAWTSSTCTEVAAVDGAFVTCACKHPGTFGVGLRSAGKCGDGRVTNGEECDDGNTKSGDGCSAKCRIEQTDGYFCLGGDTVTPSKCSFGRNDCPPMFFGPNCEYMCSQAVVDMKCAGTKFLPTASSISSVDGAQGGMIFVSSGESVSIAPKSFSGVKKIALMVYAAAKIDLQTGTLRRSAGPLGKAHDTKAAFPVGNGPVLSFFDTSRPGALTFNQDCTVTLKYNRSLEYSKESAGSSYLVYALESAMGILPTGLWQPLEATHVFDESTEKVRVNVKRTGAFAVMKIPALSSWPLTVLSRSKTPVIVGVVIGVLAAVLMAGAAIFLYRRIQAQRQKTPPIQESGTSELLCATSQDSGESNQYDAAVPQNNRQTFPVLHPETSRQRLAHGQGSTTLPSPRQETTVDMVVLHENEREVESLPAHLQPRMESIMPDFTEVADTLTATLGWASFSPMGADKGDVDYDASSETSASQASETASPVQAGIEPGETGSTEATAGLRSPQRHEEAVAQQPDVRMAASVGISPALTSFFAESMMEGRNDLIASMFFPRRDYA